MGCILDTPDALRPTGKRRNAIKTATMREVMRYGGWRKAVEAGVELPPIGGGALTLVNSGTTTPVVGTNNTVATDTPVAAQLYVVEVDCENMQPADSLMVGVRRGTTKQTLTLAQINQPAATVAAVIPAGATLLTAAGLGGAVTPSAATDSQTNTALSVAVRTSAAVYGAPLRPRVDSALQADWLNDQIALGPAYQNLGADTVNTPSNGLSLWAQGLAWGPGAAYATATAAGSPTSGSVTAGDLVLAAAGAGTASGSVTSGLTGWTASSSSGGAVGAYQIPGSTGAITFAPVFSAGAIAGGAIAAFPAMTGLLIGKAGFRGVQMQHVKQSTAFLINAGEQVSFDLFQVAGTARVFPWRLYHL